MCTALIVSMAIAALLVWSPLFRQACLAAVLLFALIVFFLVNATRAEPGWQPTGGWQCGPVRITAATDGHRERLGGALYAGGAPASARAARSAALA
jgi:hypothetical protein